MRLCCQSLPKNFENILVHTGDSVRQELAIGVRACVRVRVCVEAE